MTARAPAKKAPIVQQMPLALMEWLLSKARFPSSVAQEDLFLRIDIRCCHEHRWMAITDHPGIWKARMVSTRHNLEKGSSAALSTSEAKAVRHEDHLSQRRCSISPGREFRGCAGLHARNREALCCCAKGTSTQHSTQLESSLFPFLPCHAATASAFTAWQTCRALLPAAAPSEKLCAKIFCMPS